MSTPCETPRRPTCGNGQPLRSRIFATLSVVLPSVELVVCLACLGIWLSIWIPYPDVVGLLSPHAAATLTPEARRLLAGCIFGGAAGVLLTVGPIWCGMRPPRRRAPANPDRETC